MVCRPSFLLICEPSPRVSHKVTSPENMGGYSGPPSPGLCTLVSDIASGNWQVYFSFFCGVVQAGDLTRSLAGMIRPAHGREGDGKR